MVLQRFFGTRQQLEDFSVRRAKRLGPESSFSAESGGNHSGPIDYSAANSYPLRVTCRRAETENRDRNHGNTE